LLFTNNLFISFNFYEYFYLNLKSPRNLRNKGLKYMTDAGSEDIKSLNTAVATNSGTMLSHDIPTQP